MREVGIGKKEVAEKAKRSSIQLDKRLTEPSNGTAQNGGGETEAPSNGEKPKDGAR